MSAGIENIKVAVLTQPSTALSKNLTVNLGFRPAMVMVFNYAADSDWAVAVDTSGGPSGGLKMPKDDAASAAVGSDGISFYEHGVKLGQDGMIKTNSAKIVIIAFRDLDGQPTEVNLSSIGTTADAFGSGTQFTQGALGPLSDPVTVTAD